ncbi:hypothetical protein [Nostoc sp.]|uniref:hypothetical protein n=1 Tax=Nostoc sp. TaxID=1180 RepID=UPI002FF81C4E
MVAGHDVPIGGNLGIGKFCDPDRVFAREVAAKGEYERYKTTNQNNTTAMNPAYLG